MVTKTTSQMEMVPIEKLVPYINNARTHSPEQITKLRASLREFGFINPVIIDKDYGVIAGHGRLMAAKEEGIKEVPCVLADHWIPGPVRLFSRLQKSDAGKSIGKRRAAGMTCSALLLRQPLTTVLRGTGS